MSSVVVPGNAESRFSPVLVGLLAGAASAILFAGKGVLVRLAFRAGGDATTLLGLRMAYCLPVFALVAWACARGPGPLARWDRLGLLALGVVGYHLSPWLDFRGLEHIDAALERVVLYLYPTIIVGVAVFRGKRTVDVRLVAALALTYGGILLTWGDRIHLGGDPGMITTGVLLVSASAVVYACYIIVVEGIIARVGGIRAMAVSMLGAGMSALVHAVAVDTPGLLRQNGTVHVLALTIALVGTVAPALLMGLAIQKLDAARVSVVGMLGPVATALGAWAVLGEALGVAGWLGLVLTTVGAFAVGPAKAPSGSPRIHGNLRSS